MLLTISTTHRPATDLGYLLHKNPDRVHEASLPFGRATMFYPEAGPERCTFALTLAIDPVSLVRGRGKARQGLMDQYVNDRPYAASSFLSVAMGRALGTAFGGRSKERQALAETAIPLEATVAPVPSRGGGEFVERLFAPLGYTVETEAHPLDTTMPWLGASPYLSLRLAGHLRLKTLLEHLFVLIPVLDNRKHYYVDRDELEKLLRKGEGWLEDHPEKTLIARRYLDHRGALVREALARLADDDQDDEALDRRVQNREEETLEKPIRLNDLRLDSVVEALKASGAKRVIDLGCGEGRLVRRLLRDRQFEEIVGVDVSVRPLEIAADRLKLDWMAERQRSRVRLMQGALTYRDARYAGFDAAALVEVIEHLDPDRLPALERTVFEFARPATVVVTTPNREYNVLFENLGDGQPRHPDHRFEWTRAEFEGWARATADAHGYGVRFAPIGALDPDRGAPTQMAVFTR